MLIVNRSIRTLTCLFAVSALAGCASHRQGSQSLQQQGSVAAAQTNTQASDVCTSVAQPFVEAIGPVTNLITSLSTSATQVVSWENTRHGAAGVNVTSQWVQVPGTEGLTFCLFGGSFPATMAPPGVNMPNYTRAAIIVDSGTAYVEYLAHDDDGPAILAPNGS